MESEYLISIITFFVLIILSAFFSGSEAAYFSLSKEMIERLKESSSKSAHRVVFLLKDPKLLLITILVGNTLVNVGAASVAALLTSEISEHYHFSPNIAILSEVIIVTLIILIFSELTPKIFLPLMT